MDLLVRQGGVCPTTDKVETIDKFPEPKNATQVRQFLALCGFFRRFVPGFAAVAASHSALTSIKSSFSWGETHQRSFERLKEILKEPPVLALFDPEATVELHTDASAVGLAGMLLQPDREGKLRSVRCVSRKCTHRVVVPFIEVGVVGNFILTGEVLLLPHRSTVYSCYRLSSTSQHKHRVHTQSADGAVVRPHTGLPLRGRTPSRNSDVGCRRPVSKPCHRSFAGGGKNLLRGHYRDRP